MKSLMSSLVLASFVFLLGCPTGSNCDVTVTEWTCENGACACDQDSAECTDPATTDDADPQNCDNLCEFCE